MRVPRTLRGPLGALALLGCVVAGADALADATETQPTVLERLSKEPEILINLDPADLPSTTDMIALGRPATPAIINGLANSMAEQVRMACAAVLIGTRDPRALDALMDALDDPDFAVRSMAIQALGQVESRVATPRLLALLKKPQLPAYVSNEALQALGRLGDPAAVKPLLSWFEKTWDPAAQRALWDMRRHLDKGELKRIVLGPLEAEEGAVSDEVLGFSVEAAGDLQLEAAVEPLQEMYEAKPGLQNRIIYNLGRIGDRDAAKFLRGLVDRTAEARLLNNVAFALQRLKQDVRPLLAEGLGDRRAYIRFNSAFVAGDLKEKALVPELVKGLTDTNDFVRGEAAVALGKIAAPEAVAPLEAASREKNPIVRRDALLALAATDYAKYRERVLTELVVSDLGSVRERAIRFLADRNDPTVLSAVLSRLDPTSYSDRRVGLELIDRLWRVDNPDATAFMLRAAAEGGDRHDALRLLGRNVDERARFILKQWLNQPDGEQSQLLRAMGRYGDKDTAPLARAWLGSKDPNARLYAAFHLAALGEAEGGNALAAAVEEAPVHLKRVAAQRLTELDLEKVPGAAATVSKMLEHPDVYVRLYAARGLLERGDAKAQATLWAELEKRIPFITDEVLDIVERAPAPVREKFLPQWISKADAHLKRDLQRIRTSTAATE